MEALLLQSKPLWSPSHCHCQFITALVYFMYKPSSCNQILNEGILLSQHVLLLLKNQRTNPWLNRTGNVFAKKQVKTDLVSNAAFVLISDR